MSRVVKTISLEESDDKILAFEAIQNKLQLMQACLNEAKAISEEHGVPFTVRLEWVPDDPEDGYSDYRVPADYEDSYLPQSLITAAHDALDQQARKDAYDLSVEVALPDGSTVNIKKYDGAGWQSSSCGW